MKTVALNRRMASGAVAAFLAAGARDAVVSPGSRNTPLVLALRRAADAGRLTLHTIIDERAAAFVAIGLARMSGLPAILSCTSGSAGTHYYPAIVEANLSRLPLIVVTADRPAELQNCGAPQTMQQQGLFGEHVRYALHLEAPNTRQDVQKHTRAVELACDAFGSTAVGPIHVNMAFREPLWEDTEAHEEPTERAEPPTVSAYERPRSDSRATETSAWLFRRVIESRRGLIVWGAGEIGTSGIDYATGRRELAHCMAMVAERTGWPILSDATSGIRDMSPPCPNHVGSGDVLLRCASSTENLTPDLVLRVGGEPTSKVVSHWLRDKAGGKVVLIDPSGWSRDPGRTAERLVDGDPLQVLRQLNEQLSAHKVQTEPEWLDEWKTVDERAIRAIEKTCHGTELWAGSVANSMARCLPTGTLLHLSSSLSIRSFVSFVPTTPNGITLTANRGVNGIDGTLSTALGQCRRWTEGPTAVLLGDVAFAHDASALANVPRDRPFVVVVVDNEGGGIFDHLPISRAGQVFEEHFITAPSLDIEAIGAAYGLTTQRVTSVAGLVSALEHAVAAQTPHLIVASVDRTADYKLHQRTWAEMPGASAGGVR